MHQQPPNCSASPVALAFTMAILGAVLLAGGIVGLATAARPIPRGMVYLFRRPWAHIAYSVLLAVSGLAALLAGLAMFQQVTQP